jgi:hypothetical protein
MATIVIRHNDDPDEIAHLARSIYGKDAQISFKEGRHGEIETHVTGDDVGDHANDDLERLDFVLSVEMI